MRIHQFLRKSARLWLLLPLVLIALQESAIANSYTYQYAGFPFSVWYDSGCPPECSLTGSMTFARPLPSNLPWTTSLLSVDTLLAFSFTDGVNTYTQSNSTFKQLYGSVVCGSTPCVSTGPGGAITYWSLALLNNAGVQMLSEAYPAGGIYGNSMAGQDSILVNSQYGINLQAGSSAYGTWSGPFENGPLPEPSSLLIVCTSLLMLYAGAFSEYAKTSRSNK